MSRASALLDEKVTNSDELVMAIEKAFKKNFPNGWFNISKRHNRNQDSSITFRFGLIGDSSELTNGIIDNDPMFHTGMIWFSEPEQRYEGTMLRSGLSVNPKEKFLAMSTVKTPWRKTKGDAARLAKAYETFFGRLKGMIKTHGDDVYGRGKYSDKYFK